MAAAEPSLLEEHPLRTLCFEDYGDTGNEESDSSASKMCRRLCHKFGLESGSSMAENVLSPSFALNISLFDLIVFAMCFSL